MYHYQCTHFFVPVIGAMRVSGSYNLFPHHCIMSAFTCEEHTTAVNDKLQEEILGLNKEVKKCLLKVMATLLVTMTATINAPSQRVDKPATSEDVPQGQRVGPTPPVTTTTHGTHNSPNRAVNTPTHDQAQHARYHVDDKAASY